MLLAKLIYEKSFHLCPRNAVNVGQHLMTIECLYYENDN
jgi:hypothetical protein